MLKLALAVAGILTGSATVYAASTSSEAPQTYTMRDILIGSMIPKDVVSAEVPFDKPYEELTEAQRTVLWQDYESLKAGDETPFPDTGLRHLTVPLMKLAERKGFSGKLIAGVEIDSLGHARTVTIYKSPDAELSKFAQIALLQESYRAARCGGQPCAMTFMLRLDFIAQ